MKNKLTLSLFFAFLLSMSLSAQVTKSINPPNKVLIQSKASVLDITPNVTEDFESYTDFSTSFNPWILNDVDQTPTYGITDVSFPNSGTAMAFIIFNPNNTTPSMGSDNELAANSGEKFAACFNSIPSQGSTNNDWLITPLLEMGTNSQLSFYGKSYTIDYGNEKLKVLVSTSGTNPSDFTEISNGIIGLPADWTEYNIDLAQYNNQSIHIAFQCVSEDSFVLMLDDILVSTEENAGGSNLTGLVTNALDGAPISGALVSVAGLSTYTDDQGQYAISGVPEGILTANFMGTPTSGDSPLTVQFSDLSTSNTQLVTCSATDFITYNNNQVIIPPNGDVTLNISLSPTFSGDGMRFVLNWGADPRDLDSHIRTPEIEGSTYHVYYSSQGSAESVPYVALDHDVTQGFGPETTTIYQFFNGVYHFYIYKYAGSGEITTSSAVVQIYDENGLIQTLQAPTSGTGRYWYVGTVDGSSQTLNIINTIQDTEPGTGKRDVVYPPKQEENNRQVEITSWNWDFGDGQTSSSQSPSHIYQSGGDYTVTLTVGDGTNSNTEVKQSYIHVEGSQGTATLSGMVTNALDGTPIAGALVSVANLSAYTDTQGNYVIENVPEGSLTANFMASSTEGSNPLTVQFSDLSTSNTQLVTCSATDFITYDNNQVIIPPDGAVTLNISLSPNISGAGMRFVLNWGANPRDLDSHIRTPEIEGSTYHVYYSSQGSIESAPYVALDHDVTSGFGPETTTIYQFFNGTYHFYIYKYAGTGEITTSNAVVQIYNENGLIQTLQAPTTGTGSYWYIGTINGNSQTVHIINTIQDTEPGTGKSDVEYPAKQSVGNNQLRDIVSWSWDFGDGQSSTERNPSHTYMNNGNYTVKLSISDGNISNTETKIDFIHVSDGFSIGELNNDMISLYPNPSDGLIQISSEIKIDKIIIFNNSGKLVLDKTIDDKSVMLNIDYLPSGVYIMQVYFKNGIITKKMSIK
jgi:PKD repeat protein